MSLFRGRDYYTYIDYLINVSGKHRGEIVGIQFVDILLQAVLRKVMRK